MGYSSGIGGRSSLTADLRARIWALVAMGTCPLPPFVLMYCAQRVGEQWFGPLSLWTSLSVLVGISLGILVTVVLVLSSGVVSDIKAHEVWLALRSRLMDDRLPGHDHPSW